MKKIAFIIFTFLPFLLFGQNNSEESNGIFIEGSVNKVDDTIPYVYLISLDGKNSRDSAKVVNGKYVFHIPTKAATLITLFSKNSNDSDAYKSKNMLVFVVEPSHVKIISTDSFCNAVVTGSEIYPEYQKLRDGVRRMYQKQLNPLFNQYSINKKANDTAGVRKCQNEIDSIKNQIKQFYFRYIDEHPKSLLVPYVLSMIANDMNDKDVPKVTQIYNQFSQVQKNSYFGREIKKLSEGFDIHVGMSAPDFTQSDTSGIPISLKSFRGKYVLLDFWASWCGPCRAENPNLVKAFEKYRDKGFTILSVSLDKDGDRKKWIDAINKDGLFWTNVSDLKYFDNAAAKLYKISFIPMNFLINPSGEIIAENLRDDKLSEKLSELLH